MSTQRGKELTQAVFMALHYAAGLLALWFALDYMFSDALPYDGVIRLGSNRPKATICGFLIVAAFMLLTSANRYGRLRQKAIGYSCMALAFVTYWLIFAGSSIGF